MYTIHVYGNQRATPEQMLEKHLTIKTCTVYISGEVPEIVMWISKTQSRGWSSRKF